MDSVAESREIMEKIKFSILVPVYNAEKYLDECIQSVLKQTYQNFELILVDDGSKDSSGEICDRYAKTDERIRVVHQQNQGLLLTRRLSMRMSEGEYLLFLDSDDCFRKDTLELVYNTIKKYGCDIVLFNASTVAGFSQKSRDFGFANEQQFKGQDKHILYEKLATSSQLNNLCFKAIKRSIIDIEKDYSSFSFVSNAEDLLQTLPIIDKAENIVYIDQALYYYRQHQQSMVHKLNLNFYKSVKSVDQETDKYIIKWNRADLLPAHYALELQMCVNFIFNVIKNKQLQKEEKICELEKVATDEFFKTAFEKADRKVLKRRIYIWGRLLYKKKLNALFVRGKIRRFLISLARYMKR